MFKRLRHWLMGAPKTVDSFPSTPSSSGGDNMQVPSEAIQLGHRLLRTCLIAFDAAERIPEISELQISSHRVLIESLPLRIYVYALDSVLGDMGFKSMLRSSRPS